MFLQITADMPQAERLGYLLHKHPGKLFEKDLGWGTALVFFSELQSDKATINLVVNMDLEGFTKRQKEKDASNIYLSDKPFVAGSYLATALNKSFSSALAGKCESHPDLVEQLVKFTVVVTPCSLRSNSLAYKFFEPLGYAVEVTPISWTTSNISEVDLGETRLAKLTLTTTQTLQNLLKHLSVLIPAADKSPHAFQDETDVAAMLRRGEGWLDSHPYKGLILNRFLSYKKSLVEFATSQLVDSQEQTDTSTEVDPDSTPGMQELRLQKALQLLDLYKAKSFADVGCGSGGLIKLALKKPFETIIGVEPSAYRVERTQKLLHLDKLSGNRVKVVQGSVTYPDSRLSGVDALVLLEVIEHLAPFQLKLAEDLIFGFNSPKTVILTTPNFERNVTFEGMETKFRHRDHHFEWTREEFHNWCDSILDKYPEYAYARFGVDKDLPESELDSNQYGPITQGVVFNKFASE